MTVIYRSPKKRITSQSSSRFQNWRQIRPDRSPLRRRTRNRPYRIRVRDIWPRGEILNRTQPAVTRSAQAVEEAFETVLLDGTTRRRFSLKRAPAVPFPLPNIQEILFNFRQVHHARSVTSGSIPAARCAGKYVAARATATNRNAMPI